ncbi:hypothetical protein GOP47_0021818 [Adiantum capillus-veneris]|uniref:Uncharacterized protein n=1 Tax=Adiantum capillus-veneris TaxID=13818 RepID=A0A9D4UA97_ADICA|nr:hypothetical protein GOP47_0021818 [Adiantum capillus-veneris]
MHWDSTNIDEGSLSAACVRKSTAPTQKGSAARVRKVQSRTLAGSVLRAPAGLRSLKPRACRAEQWRLPAEDSRRHRGVRLRQRGLSPWEA